MHNPKESRELQLELLFQEFLNTPLARSLKANYEAQRSRLPRERVIPEFDDINVSQIEEGDSLGCVVSSYRMGLQAQGARDPGQAQVREILEHSGHAERSRGMIYSSTIAATKVGIQNPMMLGDFREGLGKSEAEELRRKPWVYSMAAALEKNYFIIAVVGEHARVIRGLKYSGGNDYKFITNDPLKRGSSELDPKIFINEYMENPAFLIIPSKAALTAGPRFTPGLVERNSSQKKTFVPGKKKSN